MISQSAEAKAKAHRFNATIGIALERGEAMHLPALRELIPEIAPVDAFPYAPVLGKPPLRELWRDKQHAENPSLAGKQVGMPIVTSALPRRYQATLAASRTTPPGDEAHRSLDAALAWFLKTGLNRGA